VAGPAVSAASSIRRPANCHCGGSPELRRCRQNNAVGWQCIECGKPLSPWLKHESLGDIDIQHLPAWRTERSHVPEFQQQLFAISTRS
jgi:hypothetical protein